MGTAVGITPDRADLIDQASLQLAETSIATGTKVVAKDGTVYQLVGEYGTKRVVRIAMSDDIPYDATAPEWVLPFAPVPIKLSDPSSGPVSSSYAYLIPDGSLMLTYPTGGGSGYMMRRSGDSFSTTSPSPPSIPQGTRGAWTMDAQYFAIGLIATPFIHIYKRDNSTITKLADPAVLPPGTGQEPAWTPDSSYLALGSATAPFFAWYKRSGDVFTKLTNPTTTPASSPSSAAWSPDGNYLAIGLGASSPASIEIYKRSGDSLTKIAGPNLQPPSGGVQGLAWSPNGKYLAVAVSNTPFVYVYKWSNEMLNKLPDPTGLITAGYATSVAWHPDSKVLAFGANGTQSIHFYRVEANDTFERMPFPATMIAGAVTTLKWSLDGRTLAGNANSAPYIFAYKPANEIYGGSPVRLT